MMQMNQKNKISQQRPESKLHKRQWTDKIEVTKKETKPV